MVHQHWHGLAAGDRFSDGAGQDDVAAMVEIAVAGSQTLDVAVIIEAPWRRG